MVFGQVYKTPNHRFLPNTVQPLPLPENNLHGIQIDSNPDPSQNPDPDSDLSRIDLQDIDSNPDSDSDPDSEQNFGLSRIDLQDIDSNPDSDSDPDSDKNPNFKVKPEQYSDSESVKTDDIDISHTMINTTLPIQEFVAQKLDIPDDTDFKSHLPEYSQNFLAIPAIDLSAYAAEEYIIPDQNTPEQNDTLDDYKEDYQVHYPEQNYYQDYYPEQINIPDSELVHTSKQIGFENTQTYNNYDFELFFTDTHNQSKKINIIDLINILHTQQL